MSQPKPTAAKAVPPKKTFTNGLFHPLTDQQIDMLEREYYTNKNMVGRDKLYFILKRKYGDKAPTQKAINDWLINQKTHQLHRRQFKSQTIGVVHDRVHNRRSDAARHSHLPRWVLRRLTTRAASHDRMARRPIILEVDARMYYTYCGCYVCQAA